MKRVFILIFLSIVPLWGLQQTWTLENGAKALVYFPKSFSKYKSTPVIMALHGMGEYTQPTLDKWIPIADEFNYIIIAPVGHNFKEGFSRHPIDDRKEFVEFDTLLKKHYRIDKKKSILAGFSRGGNFALETGLMYPKIFPNVLCIFGFFNTTNSDFLTKNFNPKDYKQSKIFILTSKNDFTEKSSILAQTTLNSFNIKNHLQIEKNIYHVYPDPFNKYFNTIYNWYFKN